MTILDKHYLLQLTLILDDDYPLELECLKVSYVA